MERLTFLQKILTILLILLGGLDFVFYKKIFRFGSRVDSRILPSSKDPSWVSFFIRWRIRIVGLVVAAAGIFVLIYGW